MTFAKDQTRVTVVVVQQPSQQIGGGRNAGAVSIAGDTQALDLMRSVDDYNLAVILAEMGLFQSEAAVQRVVAGGANQCVPAGVTGQAASDAIPI